MQHQTSNIERKYVFYDIFQGFLRSGQLYQPFVPYEVNIGLP